MQASLSLPASHSHTFIVSANGPGTSHRSVSASRCLAIQILGIRVSALQALMEQVRLDTAWTLHCFIRSLVHEITGSSVAAQSTHGLPQYVASCLCTLTLVCFTENTVLVLVLFGVEHPRCCACPAHAADTACDDPFSLDDSTGVLMCFMGDLEPGATANLTVNFTPTASGNFTPIMGELVFPELMDANNDTVASNNTAATWLNVVSATNYNDRLTK